jgi:hypothetical protein
MPMMCINDHIMKINLATYLYSWSFFNTVVSYRMSHIPFLLPLLLSSCVCKVINNSSSSLHSWIGRGGESGPMWYYGGGGNMGHKARKIQHSQMMEALDVGLKGLDAIH